MNADSITAVHEAAHAVAAIRFGHVVQSVAILAGDTGPCGECDTLTLCDVLALGRGERRKLARELGIVTYAGVVAERDLARVAVNPLDTYEDDRVDTIMKTAGIGPRGSCYVGDDAWQDYKRRLAGEAARIVASHSGVIHDLARVLIERRALGREEIEAIVGSPIVEAPT